MANLPYKVEYAKSGRSGCKGCKTNIQQGSMRVAIMIQSPFFDGMMPSWHHSKCFFLKTRAKSVDEFANFQSLRWSDQEELKNKIESFLASNVPLAVPEKKGKGKKGNKRAAASSVMPRDLADYTVEYAKSKRSKCKVCEEQIDKDAVRISKKDYESEVAKQYGPCERWHHIDCFIRARAELGFLASGDLLPGFMTLSPDDQELLKDKLPVIANADAVDGGSPPKKAKTEDPALENLMKKQNEALFKLRDQLDGLQTKDLTYLLEFNDQTIPVGRDRILERLSDLMTFGNIHCCEKCKEGAMIFKSGIGYNCVGRQEWGKCGHVIEKPKRFAFKVPEDLKADYLFLSKYKCKTQDRAFKKVDLPAVASTSSSSSSNGVAKKASPLSGLEFLFHKTAKDAKELEKSIVALGGKVAKKFNDQLAAVVSVAAEVSRAKPLKVISSASDSNVVVVSDDIFERIQPTSTREDVIAAFKDKKLSLWGSDISSKLAYDTVDGGKSVYPTKSVSAASKSRFKSEMGVQKLTLKGGLFVDPQSQLEKKAHVYKCGKDIYSVVLSRVDIEEQKNSYYKMQVLEADKGSRYWLFRSWGRIGTTIGGCKTEEYRTLSESTSTFCSLFEEKTGNLWDMRHDFQKNPGMMMLMDVAHGSEDAPKKLVVDDQSKLAKPIQDLIALIFDIEAMKKTMMEFELDLNKMPLGKLSKKQIMTAFSLLTKLQRAKGGGDNKGLIALNNQFYTLVPHDFGLDNPPLLDNNDIINQKIDMLNNLMDIEIAFSMMTASTDSKESPIDAHYNKLNAKISVLDKATDEFACIQKYVQNSHAETHRMYKLEILQVFKVERSGETSRFKKFNKLPNHMLLWHGSRLTNFAGILSQGLRIAPPEAPATGYMFGKGIYFADSVSKSANYCMTTQKNNTGLLLLCEVALGNMYELLQANYVEKLPAGKHSTKGIGRTQPDMSDVGKTETGAIIPYGKGKLNTQASNTALLYNEYIVYDVSQVKVQYLVEMKFKY